MQTIHIDISNKSVLPIIYAKQGDVGRKFNAIITNNGVEYPISSEKFSAWYSGVSGSGNYTEINGKSAFGIDENTVTVELAPNMLQAPGKSLFCLTMSDGDDSIIGLWNISVYTEETPGFLSDPIGDYYPGISAVLYVDQSLTKDQQERARKNIGAAAVGETGSSGSADAVLYTKQTITEEQQAQARENIGAATVSDIISALPVYNGEIASYEEGYAQGKSDTEENISLILGGEY